MSKQISEQVQLIWQHIDPKTKDTLQQHSTGQVWVNVSKFHKVMVVLFRTVGTGSIQDAKLYCHTSATSAAGTVISSSGSTECTPVIGTAFGTNATDPGVLGSRGVGMIVFELNTNDIDQYLADADFVSVKASFATATDELGVLYILSDPRYPTSGLTSTGRGSTNT